MATATLQVLTTFTPANETQPAHQTPVNVPVFSGATSVTEVAQTVLLAAAGSSYTLQVPSTWTHVDQIQITNIDINGWCVLTMNATSGAPVAVLSANGGTFACTLGPTVPAGTIAAGPTTWTLKSCDSTGVLANGVATYVYIYMTGH